MKKVIVYPSHVHLYCRQVDEKQGDGVQGELFYIGQVHHLGRETVSPVGLFRSVETSKLRHPGFLPRARSSAVSLMPVRYLTPRSVTSAGPRSLSSLRLGQVLLIVFRIPLLTRVPRLRVSSPGRSLIASSIRPR